MNLKMFLNNEFHLLQDGGTPLFVACQCNHLDVVKELLDRGADIHAQMVDGATPLFITAQNGHNHLLSFLLKQGAEVDMRRKVIIENGLDNPSPAESFKLNSTSIYGTVHYHF